MSSRLQTVHVRINDAATGKPTPCRVRFTDAAGEYHAPFGRLTTFATAPGLGVGGNVLIDGEAWATIDGGCEIDLPPGAIRVQACKGPEYRPLDETVTLIAGKLSMRLTIERGVNLRDEGWYSGDVRAHHLSTSAALLEAQAEDIAVANVLITEGRAGDEHWLGNILEFSGQQTAKQTAGHLVAVNSYNQAPMGRLSLLNTHRVVYPLTVERINWTLSDWCGQCHRKGGLVAWSDVAMEERDDYVSEGLANLLLGEVDALEIADLLSPRSGLDEWVHLLNCGVRVPIVGAGGKDSNATCLGRTRTYAKLGWGEDLDYRRWIEAVRAGRTFVSNGPFLWFSVEGQEAGSVVQTDQDKIKVRALAKSHAGIERLEIVAAGEVIAEAVGSDGESALELELPMTESTWLAARCFGPGQAAHTSAIYVERGGAAFKPRAASLDVVERWLSRYETMMKRFDAGVGFASASDRARLETIYVRAIEAVRRKKNA